MQLALHTADLSNAAKPFNVYMSWTSKVMQEFWQQGDEERQLGVPISPMCDRYNCSIKKCQQGFLKFVIAPLFHSFTSYLKSMEEATVPNITFNEQYWQTQDVDYQPFPHQSSGESEAVGSK